MAVRDCNTYLFFFRIENVYYNERKVFYMNENNSRLFKETIDKLNEVIKILEEKISEKIKTKTQNNLYKEFDVNTASRLGYPYKYKSVDLTEFNMLCKMLSKNDIKFEFKPRLGGMSLAIPNYETFSTEHDGNRTVSVACFDGTYGSENGLLEIYAPGLNKGVEGHLTADEAFEYINDTLEGKTRNSCG